MQAIYIYNRGAIVKASRGDRWTRWTDDLGRDEGRTTIIIMGPPIPGPDRIQDTRRTNQQPLSSLCLLPVFLTPDEVCYAEHSHHDSLNHFNVDSQSHEQTWDTAL